MKTKNSLHPTKSLCAKCGENPAVAYVNQLHICKKCFYLLTKKINPKIFYTCAFCHRRFKPNQILTPPIFCCEKCRHQFIKNSKNKLKGGKARNP